LQFVRRSSRLFISSVVLDEINAADENDRTQIMAVLETVGATVLELEPESRDLARFYIASNILPARKVEDALHVAIATTQKIDVLVSWNHKHMANVRKSQQYCGANLMRGYAQTPLILTPLEVLHD